MHFMLINHTHTDIGYTDPQYVIEAAQVDFLRQAMDVCDAYADAAFPYRWTCETFWAVERFWRQASGAERERFAGLVKQGLIGLSANYLNFNELIDQGLMERLAKRAEVFGQSIGSPVRSAMTADINGYQWGFCAALLDAGVEGLFSNVHAHHGRHPLRTPQTGFFWRAADGRRLLVWSGEHYQLGNEMGMVPHAGGSYLFGDSKTEAEAQRDTWKLAQERIPAYVERLRGRDYPFQFVPMMVNGLRTDNAPPNGGIAEFVARWNSSGDSGATMEMVTLDQFFDRVRAADVVLPEFSGDWPDWWAEGSGSYPKIVRICRDAQREYKRAEAIGASFDDVAGLLPDEQRGIDDCVSLAAEHTFSHSESMSEPWHPLVHEIEAQKAAYAVEALTRSRRAVARMAAHWGDIPLNAAHVVGEDRTFVVVNPFGKPWEGPVRLTLAHHDPLVAVSGANAEVLEPDHNGRRAPSETCGVARGMAWDVFLRLEPRESRRLRIVAGPQRSSGGAAGTPASGAGELRTPTLSIAWDANGTVLSVVDRESGASLIDENAEHAPFTLIRQLTPCGLPDEVRSSRQAMLLDRRGADVQTSVSRVTRILPVREGEISNGVVFRLECAGLGFAELELRAFHAARRLDAVYRVQKECVWEAENLFAAVPFAPSGEAQMWLDRAGAPVRPWVDQLPGTLTDFYAVQAGWMGTDGWRGVALHMPDTHLLHVGPLAPGTRRLMGDVELQDDRPRPYAWLLNNFWETNFATSPAGFLEFRFSLLWGEELADPATAFGVLGRLLPGPVVVQQPGLSR